MNAEKVKEIKRICNNNDKLYKMAKKAYMDTPTKEKPYFTDNLKKLIRMINES